ncbi:PREDICTED: uncharacterized protein LOC109344841 [Lupinus angustifolius]|uniref:uncharacterized protein LOC109344841 n=1 Tax=Lupinus angustifolius TaxID=3871 RepID=UPI00092FD6B2|nr:PREDICTED: uncharacterized protein LOC109344841 [Lupinus angustifolius]
MALVEMKKGVVVMVVMIMLVLANASDIASSPQDDQNIQPHSRFSCLLLCPLRCNPLKIIFGYGACVTKCVIECDINNSIAKYHATDFSKLEDVNNIDDRDGMNTYVNSFLEDDKSN